MEELARPVVKEYAGLRAIEFPAPPGAATIVFFHGYGANGADLAPLAAELGLPRPARWLFPDAPLELDFGGLAWFAIDAAAIDRAQRSGKAVDWSGSDPIPEPLRRRAREFLEAAGAPWEDLILGGFSQGSMLALDLALRAPRAPRGVAILSGNLVSETSWKQLARAKPGLRFFQSHGLADPILGHAGARRLESLLREAGLDGRLLSFEGGHAIPSEAALGLREFLSSLV